MKNNYKYMHNKWHRGQCNMAFAKTNVCCTWCWGRHHCMLHTNFVFATTIDLRQFNATLLEKHVVYTILKYDVFMFMLLILKQNTSTKTNGTIPTQ